MYKVSLFDTPPELIIHREEIVASELGGDFIGSVTLENNSYAAWNYDSGLENNGGAIRKDWRNDSGSESTAALAFFKLKLKLTEFGFEGIMDLELPSEFLGV